VRRFLREAGVGIEGKSYKGYQTRVELDDEAGVFQGEVIYTRDVISFRGSPV
jgi:predicted HicB family RNase H-like nuclease